MGSTEFKYEDMTWGEIARLTFNRLFSIGVALLLFYYIGIPQLGGI